MPNFRALIVSLTSTGDPAVKDAALIGAAQKVEHYEIAAYGTARTFARVLGVYVREKHVLTLEDAVRRMSGYPAQRLKMWDRGLLRPGMKADIAVFRAGEPEDDVTLLLVRRLAEARATRGAGARAEIATA